MPRKRVGVLPIEPAWICKEIHSNETHVKKNITIVVIGGTGLIGTKVVKNLRQRGYEVVAASPSSGVNTVTGEGLAEEVSDQSLVPGHHPRLGSMHFAEWLSQSTTRRELRKAA